MMDEVQAPDELVEISSSTNTRWYNKPKDLGILGLIIFLVLIAVGSSFLALSSSSDKKVPDQKESTNEYIADGTIVYGYWNDSKSVVSAIDLTINKSKVLAVLPENIKHVKVISNNSLSYISDTDKFDYGKRLMMYEIDPGSTRELFVTDDGYGLDDYVISQNGQLGAIWVVSEPDLNGNLLGNQSRVYTINLITGEKNLIYDETSSTTNPVHYPVGITNGGEVYLDTFVPNSGAGWAYGMSKSNFNGTTKADIQSMKGGSYSTQPTMSSDESYIAFAGYDGNDGNSKINTFRKAIVNPVTVELLSTSDEKRTRIETGLSNTIYPLVYWDESNSNLIISATTNSGGSVVQNKYSYSPALKKFSLIENNDTLEILNKMRDGNLLLGQRFPNDSGVGNLGPSYSISLNKLVVFDTNKNTSHALSFDTLPVQLIAVKDASYFPALKSDKRLLSDKSAQQLKLKTFELKPTLIPVREERQSTPRVPVDLPESDPPPLCRTMTYPQCNALLGKNHPIGTDIGDLGDPEFSKCVEAQQAALEAKNTCADSPLYLYGEKGMRISVKFGTTISNTNINITDNEISGILDGFGGIKAFGRSVPSISYDYIPRVKVLERPQRGYIVEGRLLQNKFVEISHNFKFNDLEKGEILSKISGLKAPYYFVSFYNDKDSHDILPLNFTPEPNNYRNIVFYIEALTENSDLNILPPLIKPIQRNGFTAVEISYIFR